MVVRMPRVAQHRGKAKQIRVHQRLAAGEDHPFDAEASISSEVPLQFGGADLLRVGDASRCRTSRSGSCSDCAAPAPESADARARGFMGGSVCRRGAGPVPRCFAAARAQSADVGVHQHRRAAFDVQQLEARGARRRELAREFRRDQADAAGHHHQCDGAIEERLDRRAAPGADGDPIAAPWPMRRDAGCAPAARSPFRRGAPAAGNGAPPRVRRADRTGALRAESVASAIGNAGAQHRARDGAAEHAQVGRRAPDQRSAAPPHQVERRAA